MIWQMSKSNRHPLLVSNPQSQNWQVTSLTVTLRGSWRCAPRFYWFYNRNTPDSTPRRSGCTDIQTYFGLVTGRQFCLFLDWEGSFGYSRIAWKGLEYWTGRFLPSQNSLFSAVLNSILAMRGLSTQRQPWFLTESSQTDFWMKSQT